MHRYKFKEKLKKKLQICYFDCFDSFSVDRKEVNRKTTNLSRHDLNLDTSSVKKAFQFATARAREYWILLKPRR